LHPWRAHNVKNFGDRFFTACQVLVPGVWGPLPSPPSFPLLPVSRGSIKVPIGARLFAFEWTCPLGPILGHNPMGNSTSGLWGGEKFYPRERKGNCFLGPRNGCRRRTTPRPSGLFNVRWDVFRGAVWVVVSGPSVLNLLAPTIFPAYSKQGKEVATCTLHHQQLCLFFPWVIR